MVPNSQGIQGHEIFSSIVQASDWSEWKSVESWAKKSVVQAAARQKAAEIYDLGPLGCDALAAHLNVHGVQTTVDYPTTLSFLEICSRLTARREQFPTGTILSLPMFAEITRERPLSASSRSLARRRLRFCLR
jgi:hypothetical protein